MRLPVNKGVDGWIDNVRCGPPAPPRDAMKDFPIQRPYPGNAEEIELRKVAAIILPVISKNLRHHGPVTEWDKYGTPGARRLLFEIECLAVGDLLSSGPREGVFRRVDYHVDSLLESTEISGRLTQLIERERVRRRSKGKGMPPWLDTRKHLLLRKVQNRTKRLLTLQEEREEKLNRLPFQHILDRKVLAHHWNGSRGMFRRLLMSAYLLPRPIAIVRRSDQQYWDRVSRVDLDLFVLLSGVCALPGDYLLRDVEDFVGKMSQSEKYAINQLLLVPGDMPAHISEAYYISEERKRGDLRDVATLKKEYVQAKECTKDTIRKLFYFCSQASGYFNRDRYTKPYETELHI